VVVPAFPIITIAAVVTILPVVISILSWTGDRQRPGQCHHRYACNQFPHAASLLENINKALGLVPLRPIVTVSER
jgi:hypothetical protein